MTQYVIIAKRNIWRGRKNHARSRIKENISRKEKGTFMSKVRRVYVEKKLAFAVKAKELQAEIKSYLGISSVTGVRELIRYDIENISEETYKKALVTVFSEPPVDTVFEEPFELGNAKTFSVEYLPGQFLGRVAESLRQVPRPRMGPQRGVRRLQDVAFLSGRRYAPARRPGASDVLSLQAIAIVGNTIGERLSNRSLKLKIVPVRIIPTEH